MPDLITMDGQYAYACDPYTQVRILCVDAPGEWPVITVNQVGDLRRYDAQGRHPNSNGHNLVPLQHRRKPVEAWAVVDKRGDIVCTDAHRDYCETILEPGQRLVRLIEAEEAP